MSHRFMSSNEKELALELALQKKILLRAETSFSDDEGESSDETFSLLDAQEEVHQEEAKAAKLPDDVEKYMAKRQMSPLQERTNAITMVPPALYCLSFVLSGNWVSQELVEQAKMDLGTVQEDFAANHCLDASNLWAPIGPFLQHLHAAPPLPIVFVLLGCLLQTPFSILYHWHYAHSLAPGPRTLHWSRRLDQAMIHMSSAITSYGTSGRWDYFLFNVLFNAESAYRQFETKVNPKRNKIRLGTAIFLWTFPVLCRGLFDIYFQLMLVLGIGICFFVFYPIAGWSHSVFHLCFIPMMPLVMQSSLSLPDSQDSIRVAAQCFALAGDSVGL